MTVFGRDLIFQPVLASLPYTQIGTYDNDTILTLQDILTYRFSIKIIYIYKEDKIQADVFGMALKLSNYTLKMITKRDISGIESEATLGATTSLSA